MQSKPSSDGKKSSKSTLPKKKDQYNNVLNKLTKAYAPQLISASYENDDYGAQEDIEDGQKLFGQELQEKYADDIESSSIISESPQVVEEPKKKSSKKVNQQPKQKSNKTKKIQKKPRKKESKKQTSQEDLCRQTIMLFASTVEDQEIAQMLQQVAQNPDVTRILLKNCSNYVQIMVNDKNKTSYPRIFNSIRKLLGKTLVPTKTVQQANQQYIDKIKNSVNTTPLVPASYVPAYVPQKIVIDSTNCWQLFTQQLVKITQKQNQDLKLAIFPRLSSNPQMGFLNTLFGLLVKKQYPTIRTMLGIKKIQQSVQTTTTQSYCPQCVKPQITLENGKQVLNKTKSGNYTKVIGPTKPCNECLARLSNLDGSHQIIVNNKEELLKAQVCAAHFLKKTGKITQQQFHQFCRVHQLRTELGQLPRWNSTKLQVVQGKNNSFKFVFTVPLGQGIALDVNNIYYHKISGNTGFVTIVATTTNKFYNLWGKTVVSYWTQQELNLMAKGKTQSYVVSTINSHRGGMKSRALYDYVLSFCLWNSLKLKWGKCNTPCFRETFSKDSEPAAPIVSRKAHQLFSDQ